MGSFFDNIHVHTTDRPLIERAWQGYWNDRQDASWTWVSPVYGGWVSLFDWRCDQTDASTLTDLASYVSRAVDAVALAFQVQDSELAEYWLFHHGEEVDHYTSNVEYFASYAQRPDIAQDTGVFSGFGPDMKSGYPSDEDNSDGGNTSLLHSLTGTVASEMELDAILRTPAYIADDILTALASAIGINDTWASLGYYYLATEGDTVVGFEQFSHLPPNHPPRMDRFTER